MCVYVCVFEKCINFMKLFGSTRASEEFPATFAGLTVVTLLDYQLVGRKITKYDVMIVTEIYF